MKTKTNLLAAGMLLTVLLNGMCQPVITTAPLSRTNVVGTDAIFTVLATGTEPLAYQWRLSTADLAGKTNDTLIVTNVQTANAGSYTVVVTNVTGAVTSVVATLTLLVPPAIIRHPTNLSVSLGATAAFSVLATGTTPRFYQWRFNETNLPGKTSTSLVVTNVQLTNAGDYTVVVTNVAGSVTSHVAKLEVDATFTKITSGSIVTEAGYGINCAWGDYDDDGFIDLIVTVASEETPIAQKNVLFHNNRDGTFTKSTNTVVTSEGRDWRGCAWADYNNDGNLDLFVTSTDVVGFPAQNELFRNNGDGTFTKMTANSVGDIVSLAAGGSEGPVWADYDNDGFLDLFIARYGPDWLFHNNGDGTFRRITNSIPSDNQDSYFAAWGDYNNDGRPDLFVAVKSDPPTNRLYLNLGAGSFARVTSGSIATDSAHSFGCAWGDYDNDGNPDLFVSNGGYVASETNFLYHNNGNGTFTKMTSNAAGSIVSDAGGFISCAWGDYDNDGFLDLFLTTYACCTDPRVNFLYHNNGDGTFTRILTGSLVNDAGFANSCAWADYDNDGFLDLFAARAANVKSSNLLYRNNGNSNAWIKIKLVGTASNRSAIGAKVRVQATVGGKAIWQMREITTGSGFNQNALEAHFGLGDATTIDLVRIEWPSGIVQTLTNVVAKQFLTVVEHQSQVVVLTPQFTGVSCSTNGDLNLPVRGEVGLLYVLEASTNLLNWTKVAVRSNSTGTVEFTDSKSTNYTRRFYGVSVP